ncbi:Uncharacterized protein TCM_022473 [Theobroma cacao]|uniref:Uncharacterized protein n=1 Tax=Theobroma cacao TaxID=3641 RepID=A0A061ETJ3_THECC|nr:Uncharacterized protein TCM_022473 [Theobroma cacao]
MILFFFDRLKYHHGDPWVEKRMTWQSFDMPHGSLLTCHMGTVIDNGETKEDGQFMEDFESDDDEIEQDSEGFRSDEASIDLVATWIRLQGMPLKFYDKKESDKLRRVEDDMFPLCQVWAWS